MVLCFCGGQAFAPTFAVPAALPRHPAPVDAAVGGAASTKGGATAEQCRRATNSSGGGRAAAAGLSVALAVFFALPAPSLAAEGMPGSGPGCSTTTNPSYSVVSCVRTGLDRNGRLLGCSSSENCLSTSAVKVPGKLGSPWEYSRQTSDADRAFASLVRAVEDTSEVTVKTIDAKGYYILAEFPSKVPPGSVDSVEFLVKPEDQIVLYRSVSRDTLFLYPLQQPVSDQGKIKERLEGIRKDLGWTMSVRERLVLSLLTGATLTTCGGIWWMRKNDPALLLSKEYRDQYRKTAAARKEQSQIERAFAQQQAFADQQKSAEEDQQSQYQRRR
eukprot:g6243.t1